ncbi:enoyl-CoA delta isomerase 2-like isoform X3 [Cherax quadricarinatus]|uniref:enoyl-CoA delta isomerase 2-like isoform X3 n=1 Tax=Cherax quadricarinatus TaxID=27406 RepID=UPI00387ED720
MYTKYQRKSHKCAGIRSFGSFSRHLPWTRTLKVMEHPARLTVGRIRTLSSNIEFSESAESDTKFVDSSKYEHLIITRQHGVRTITFNRPDKKNALNEKMFDEVVLALQDAASDPHTIITATTGAGDVYCAGNDKANFYHITLTEIRDLLIRHMAAFIDFPKPLIAVVNGAAVGVATTLLPLFDGVFATEKAFFFTPFSALNITAEGCSSYTFPRLMGPGKAAEILMFNKKYIVSCIWQVTAREALKLGLVTEVIPDANFPEDVWPKIYDMAKLPLNSLVYSKALMRNIHKDILHQVNIEECKRVAERLIAAYQPGREDYQEFVDNNW